MRECNFLTNVQYDIYESWEEVKKIYNIHVDIERGKAVNEAIAKKELEQYKVKIIPNVSRYTYEYKNINESSLFFIESLINEDFKIVIFKTLIEALTFYDSYIKTLTALKDIKDKAEQENDTEEESK